MSSPSSYNAFPVIYLILTLMRSLTLNFSLYCYGRKPTSEQCVEILHAKIIANLVCRVGAGERVRNAGDPIFCAAPAKSRNRWEAHFWAVIC